MVNPEVLKCHEDLITLETYVQLGKTMDKKFFICENINIFGYLGAWGGGGGGASIIRLGPSWFYPLFNNNSHVKYRSNLIRSF